MVPPRDPRQNVPRSLKLRPTEGEVVNRSLARSKGPSGDGPAPEDLERFSDPTRTCPNCRKQVFDDSEVCYHCGEAMDAPEHRGKKPWWTIVVVVVLIGTLLLGLIGGLRF